MTTDLASTDGDRGRPGSAPAWAAPPRAPEVGPATVDLWRIALRWPEEVVERLHETLSPSERARASRFRSDVDRDDFVVGRGAVRRILAGYLACEPNDLPLEAGEFGKPRLVPSEDRPGLEFNLSHASGLAVLAVGVGRRVGVDLEAIRSSSSMDAIVERFFTEREKARYSGLPIGRKSGAFFRAWTTKEAYLKAIGTGLATPIDAVEVSIEPDGPPMLLDVRGDPAEARRWGVIGLDVGPGYVCTVALEGGEVAIRRYAFAPEGHS